MVMPSSLENVEFKNKFMRTNRKLTMALVLIVIVCSVLFWLLGYESGGETSVWIGSALMLLAVLFYKLPHLSFMLTKKQFIAAGQSTKDDHVLANWQTFKLWMERDQSL